MNTFLITEAGKLTCVQIPLKQTEQKANERAEQTLHRIRNNVHRLATMSEPSKRTFMNHLVRAVVLLPFSSAAMTIDTILLTQQNTPDMAMYYIKLAKTHLLLSRGDCRKIASINAIECVEHPANIPDILTNSQGKQEHRVQDDIVQKVLLYLQHTTTIERVEGRKALEDAIIRAATDIKNDAMHCSENTKKCLTGIIKVIQKN